MGKLQGGERLEMLKAARLYHDFTGHVGETEVHRLKVPDLPKAAAVFGRLHALEYDTVRDGKREYYRHVFKQKSAPMFCVSPDGEQILLIGGNYHVTDRGIEDR